MTVTLPDDLAKFIDEQVQAGRYPDPTSAVVGWLSALREAEILSDGNIDELRAEIQLGLDDLREGRSAPWDPEEIKAEGRRLLAESAARARKPRD